MMSEGVNTTHQTISIDSHPNSVETTNTFVIVFEV